MAVVAKQSTAKADVVFLPALVLKLALIYKSCLLRHNGNGKNKHHWHSEGVHQIYLGAAFYAIDGRI